VSQISMVAIIAALLLVPLGPATAIYYLLSTRRARERTHVTGKGLNVLGFQISFEAFGSTATYLVILALAMSLFVQMRSDDQRDRNKALEEARLDREAHLQAAWQVVAPVYIEGPTGDLDASDPTYERIQTSVLPFQSISNNLVTFWVIKERGRFPQVNLAIANTAGHSIDLNDSSNIEMDEVNNKLTVATPTVLTLQAAYDAPIARGPPQ